MLPLPDQHQPKSCPEASYLQHGCLHQPGFKELELIPGRLKSESLTEHLGSDTALDVTVVCPLLARRLDSSISTLGHTIIVAFNIK